MHVNQLSNAKIYRCTINPHFILAALILHVEHDIILVTRYGDYKYSDVHGVCLATKQKQFPISIPATEWMAETQDLTEISELVDARFTAQLSL